MKLAVLGDPLSHTRSPDLHRAGLAALGLAGESMAVRTPPERLRATLDRLARDGLHGVNLTHPLKAAVLSHLQRVTPLAGRAGSVNTVGFDAGTWWGDTTDGPGFIDFLEACGRPARDIHVLVMGAGGAARSLAWSLADAGAASIRLASRHAARDGERFRDVPSVATVAWGAPALQDALASAALVVNATPIDAPGGPLAVDSIPGGALVVDLVYGPDVTPWILEARARGLAAFDGLGLLVHQARRSLELWTGRQVPLDALQRAVGWPR